MLTDVRRCTIGHGCTILGTGRSILDDHQRYSNTQFLHAGLSKDGRQTLYKELAQGMPKTDAELERMADEKFTAATGITSRYIYAGSLSDLAALAAGDALSRAGIPPERVDAILVGTNTADEYNIANGVKQRIGAPVGAYCNTMMAACPVGANVIYEGWKMVRLGCTCVLAIGAERATTLASKDEYRSANLFGDAAGCVILGPGTTEAFTFFAYASDPYYEKDRWIRRESTGFTQEGKLVHKYVGTQVVAELDRVIASLGIDPATFDHFFPHQASAKTNELFVKNLAKRWPGFRAVAHANVVEMGNTSAASTPWMIAQTDAAGELLSGQRCLVATFGAGMSYSFYGFTVP